LLKGLSLKGLQLKVPAYIRMISGFENQAVLSRGRTGNEHSMLISKFGLSKFACSCVTVLIS
jgi:hypothetical protein